MPGYKTFQGRKKKSFQSSPGLLKEFLIPDSIKQIDRKLVRNGSPGLSYRDIQLMAQLAKAGLVNDSLVQWYDANYGITQSSNSVSQWLSMATSRVSLNQNLKQATGANQPSWLRWTGANYGYLNGSLGNYFSTPDSVAVSVTGDIDLRANVALDNWVPVQVGGAFIIAKRSSNFSYRLSIDQTTGFLNLTWSANGSVQLSSKSTVAPTVSNFASLWVRATLQVNNGASGNTATFYTSTDGVNWTILGIPVITAGVTSIFDSPDAVEIGSQAGGTAGLVSERILRAQILNGINGPVVFDFNPATYVSGPTFTDSSVNAAVITLNGGSVVVTGSSVYFNGGSVVLQTGVFPLLQPFTVYFVGKQLTWTNAFRLFDSGPGQSVCDILQVSSSPSFGITQGNLPNNGWALQTSAAILGVFNTTSSQDRVNRTAAINGNGNANNPNGISLGNNRIGNQGANTTFSEVLVFNIPLTTAQQDIVIGYLSQKWNLGL